MKRILFLIMLLSLSAAEYSVTAMDVVIEVNEDGTAEITENIYLLITTDYHISLYKTGITQNDLASWSTLTGLSNVRYHVDNRYVDVSNVVVRPQPVSRCNPLADLCHGELSITYKVGPYMDSMGNPVNETGLFTADSYKPRTTKYTLNSRAIRFEESELRDVILGKDQRLTFLIPAKATIIEVTPLPEDVSKEEIRDAKSLSWENTVLAHFNIVFEKEESLDEEVLGFFLDSRNTFNSIVSGPEGPALIVLILIMVGAYLHLQGKVKKVAK